MRRVTGWTWSPKKIKVPGSFVRSLLFLPVVACAACSSGGSKGADPLGSDSAPRCVVPEFSWSFLGVILEVLLESPLNVGGHAPRSPLKGVVAGVDDSQDGDAEGKTSLLGGAGW
jgi:hypothetical protein